MNRHINNTNLADAAGLMSFLCGHSYSQRSAVISQYEIVLDQRYTDYEYCNHGKCRSLVQSFGIRYGVGKKNLDFSNPCKHDFLFLEK